MKWSSSLKLGIESIDSQHQTIVERIDRLDMALDNQYDTVSYERLVEAHNFLKDYVATHFREEEEAMAKGNYPDIEAHKAMHHIFENELVKFRADLDKGGQVSFSTGRLVSYLSKWFVNHIQKDDPKYVPYVQPKQ